MRNFTIVVDMQYDFIYGPFGTKEAQEIVPAVVNTVAEAKSNGETVVLTQDTHDENYLETQEGKKLPVIHGIEGTEGWQIIAEIDTTGCILVKKNTFGYLGWRDIIGPDGEDVRIRLVGVCTGICVSSNAIILKAMYPNATIVVDPRACACVTPESHRCALETMKSCQIEIAYPIEDFKP